MAKLYDLDGHVLLIGVGFDKNTILHLAEYRANFSGKRVITEGARIIEKGTSIWREFKEIEVCTEDFLELGEDFKQYTKLLQSGVIGQVESCLMPVKELVDFAVPWIGKHRTDST